LIQFIKGGFILIDNEEMNLQSRVVRKREVKYEELYTPFMELGWIILARPTVLNCVLKTHAEEGEVISCYRTALLRFLSKLPRQLAPSHTQGPSILTLAYADETSTPRPCTNNKPQMRKLLKHTIKIWLSEKLF